MLLKVTNLSCALFSSCVISRVYRLSVRELAIVLAVSTHGRPAFLLPKTVAGLSTYTGLDVFQLFNYSVTHAAFSSFINL